MVRKPAVSYGMGFRKMLLLVLIVTSIPFLAISAFVNIRFLSNQQQEAQRVILSMASQAEEQISSHYRTLRSLAQTLSISSVLQKDVLTSSGIQRRYIRMFNSRDEIQIYEERYYGGRTHRGSFQTKGNQRRFH